MAATYGDRVPALRRAVDEAHGDVAVTAVPRPAGPPIGIPADLEDQMRLLGYL